MEYVDWIFKIIVGAGLFWALKELRVQRIKYVDEKIADTKITPKSAGESYLSAAEIGQWLEKTKHEIMEETEKDMNHVHELIEKDLEHGRKKMDDLSAEQKKTTESVGKMTTTLELLQGAVERACNAKIPATSG